MKKITCLAFCLSFTLAGSLQATDVPGVECKGHRGTVYSAAFSPDGKKIVTASGDRTARIWNAETGNELQRLTGHTNSVRSAAFSPDGKSIVTAGEDRSVRIWDVETGKELRKLTGHTSRVNSVAFSPDGKRIVTASGDRTARVWDVETATELQTLQGHTDWVHSATFSQDEAKIVTTSEDRTVRIWVAESGQELRKLEGHTNWVHSAVFSPDGRNIVSAGGSNTARIWDAESGRVLRQLEGHTSWILSVAFSPDGTKIVTASEDRTARLWDTEFGKELRTLEGHIDKVHSAVFSPDGEKIVTAGGDGVVRIWNLPVAVQSGQEAEAGQEAVLEMEFLDLDMELRKNGFEFMSDLNNFVQFGTAELKDLYTNGDEFDRAEVAPKIETAKAEIAQKIFHTEYAYSTSNVQVSGNVSNFTMTIPTAFTATTITEVSFSLPGIVGASNNAPSGITLSVSGTTRNIRELVRNSADYRVRVRFTNLQSIEPDSLSADVLKIEVIEIRSGDKQ